jgi:hypothetical protein
MNVNITCWNRDHFEGELIDSQLNINGHSVQLVDIKSLEFRSDSSGSPPVNRISGTAHLVDARLDFVIAKKGFFERWKGNIEGFFSVHVKSLGATKKIFVHEIKEISFSN